MKTKTNLKILLVIAVLLIISCIFNFSIVNATETATNEITTTKTDEAVSSTAEKTTPSEDTLKLIPDTITVTQKESQFEELFESGKGNQEIKQLIKDTLEKQNVDLTGYEIIFDIEGNVHASADIHKATIYLLRKSDSNYNLTKEVNVKYSNSDSFNEKDKKAVQAVADTITNPWHTFGFDEEIPENVFENDMKEWVTDKSVTYKIIGGNAGGGGELWSYFSTYSIFFFKNDKCYVSKNVYFDISREIIIPENIRDTEEAYINYALPIIKANSYTKDIKVVRQDNNSQWYNVYVKNSVDGLYHEEEAPADYILIKKENAFMVYDGITISSNANVTLSTEKMESTSSHYTDMQKVLKEKGYNNVLNAFEIKLSSGNVTNGLELTFDVGTEYNGKQVMILHQKQDGTYEEFEKTVENGKVKITVTELSPFMVALKDNISTTPNRVLDNEPKTGVINYTVFASVIAVISLGGLAILKFKKY